MEISQALHHAGAFPDTIVASIQMEPRVGDSAGNLSRSLQMIEEAAAAGAALVVLPELANSGYVFHSRDEAFALAEPLPGGACASGWIEAARRLGIHIVAGIAERDGNRLYNSALVAGPDGYLGSYRKLHLWGDEHLFFESGNLGLPIFDTRIGRLAVAICYDGWFPEVYRLLAMQGADIVCMPTNWVPMPGQAQQQTAMANVLAMAGAHSNGVNIVCADRVGTERGQAFIGRSLIVSAEGWPLAGPASASEEEILYARINLRQSRHARHLNAFNHVLRDRRDDLYDPMLGTGWPLPRH
ncbi:nitrilase family protein [Cupriavidus basilensis]|uniref:Nitrilase family protein n=1 Tax=Cupriavidus basilensis TaxID=68895 RepID=A0ABT6B0U4_9BURK|nr:nitrilase family protein [Cupriavidus basilensis]MDF3838502.1 nitrilase family protein [Cupriavidus basilensis]